MLRLAVIGAGHWGPNLIRNFHGREVSEVRWVVDRNEQRLAEVRARFPEVAVGTDAGPAIADALVDAVVVATPTSTHYALARRALEAGKHVLVEKPISRTVREAEELCALAAAGGRVLMVGHIFLYNPGIRRVREMLDDGRLGRVYYASMTRTNLGPIRMDVNAAWDLAAHDISIVNYWLGAEPRTVSASGGSWINAGVHDTVFATLRYAPDVLVNVHVSWLSPRKTREIIIVGEKRMLTFDDMNLSEPLRIYDRQVTDELTAAGWVDSLTSFRASIREGDITIPSVKLGEPLRVECEHFLECIRTGRPPLTGGREGLAVVRTLEAIERSMHGAGREEPV